MQAIEDLEPVRRGVYCGAIGWVDGDRGRAELAVAIRTFTIAGGRTYLGVGGGIVADSQPDDEWAETELKAARLLAAAGAARVRRRRAGIARDRLDRTASSSPLDDARRLAARPRPRRRRRRVRDAARLRRRAVRVDAATSPACTRRRDGLGLAAPDAGELRAAADAVLAANDLARGPPAHHRDRRPRAARFAPRAGAADGDRRRVPSSSRPSPTADVMIVPWTRNEGGALAGLKTISYAENVRALAYAEEHGADEAIFANTAGQPLRGDRLERVPRARRRVLHAAARGRLPQRRDPPARCSSSARELGIPIEERDVPVDALARRRRGVPLVDRPRGAADRHASTASRSPPSPGPITDRLAAAFTDLVARPRPLSANRRDVRYARAHAGSVAEVDDVAGGDDPSVAVVGA